MPQREEQEPLLQPSQPAQTSSSQCDNTPETQAKGADMLGGGDSVCDVAHGSRAAPARPSPGTTDGAPDSGALAEPLLDLGERQASDPGAHTAAGSGVGADTSLSLGRSAAGSSYSEPTCLICQESLTPEEFEAGEAMSLQCACRGDVALRHRKCAIQWSHYKGDLMCDICKQAIANLPPIPASVLEQRAATEQRQNATEFAAVLQLVTRLARIAGDLEAAPRPADYLLAPVRASWSHLLHYAENLIGIVFVFCLVVFQLSSYLPGAGSSWPDLGWPACIDAAMAVCAVGGVVVMVVAYWVELWRVFRAARAARRAAAERAELLASPPMLARMLLARGDEAV